MPLSQSKSPNVILAIHEKNERFNRVSVVKHVNVYVIQLPNVIRIHVGLVQPVSMFPISTMLVYVHRIILVKIVELFLLVNQIAVTMVEHVKQLVCCE